MEQQQKEHLSFWQTLKILFGASKGFWLVNMVNFGDGIAYFGLLTLLTRFLGTRVGMSDQITGVSVSMFSGLVTILMFGGGFVTDKFGVRKTISMCLVGLLIGRTMTTLASFFVGAYPLQYIFAWGGLFIVATASAVLLPALYAGVKEYTDPRTATVGYGLLYSIMNLGIVAENFISPFIRSDETFLNLSFTKIVGLGWGIEGVYWVCVGITGLMLLTHMTFFTRKVEDTCRVVKPEETHEHKNITIIQRIKELPFLDARFMFFIFILLPVRTLFAHNFLTIPDYVFRVFPAEVGAKFEWLNGLNPFIIVIFTPLIAGLTRKVRVVDMMIVGTIVSAVSTFFLVPSASLTFLLTYFFIYSIGEAVWSSRFLEYVADSAPAGKVGGYMGIAGIPWFLAKATTGLYSGSMLAKYIPAEGAKDPATLWTIYAIIGCISPIGLLIARKWLLANKKTTK